MIRKMALAIAKTIIVPGVVAMVIWAAFRIAGGEMISSYQGPGILGWLAGVYTKMDFGLAGEWTTSGQSLAPHLWQALGNTGIVALAAISAACLFSLGWGYLVWKFPLNPAVRVGSVVLRFFSSWPILIGAIMVAVVIKGRVFSSLLAPALILALCDNNLNDFKDNLVTEIKNVLRSDYAQAVVGQGRSFIRNLAPEITWKVLSFMACRLPAIVSGIIVLEIYYNINGIYVFLEIFYDAKDLNAILGITFLVSLVLTAWSSAFTIVHSAIDPRQR
jgi:ABC-type dipeptide/oligopeptide/nickel transport system permease component